MITESRRFNTNYIYSSNHWTHWGLEMVLWRQSSYRKVNIINLKYENSLVIIIHASDNKQKPNICQPQGEGKSWIKKKHFQVDIKNIIFKIFWVKEFPISLHKFWVFFEIYEGYSSKNCDKWKKISFYSTKYTIWLK